MKIAFYAPMKAPDHPVPSGDRQMATLLIKALERGGHEVLLASRLRAYMSRPSSETLKTLLASSRDESARIAAQWDTGSPPDLWFTYHPYYKALDLIGPALSRRFSMPYVTCEASYARKRDHDAWKDAQECLKLGLAQSSLNIFFTERDREGLAEILPASTLAELKPFTDMTARSAPRGVQLDSTRLITVAMMREGDKFESYRLLAASLEALLDLTWHLTVIGDGPLAKEVRGLFRRLPEARVAWKGELARHEVASELGKAGLFLWPGFGEAYGMAFLEAQAAGLPVIAQRTAGVPTVVRHGETGILVAPGDVTAFSAAVRGCILDPSETRRLGGQAQQFVESERSVDQAAAKLGTLLATLMCRAGT
ncbi:MAG TPA: glycosyltransferase family 4 protein [Aestuariivirgaceae bacterium]